MRLQDIDLLISPLDSIRFDVSQILDIMKSSSSSVQKARKQFSDSAQVFQDSMSSFQKQMGQGFTKQMQDFKRLMSDIVLSPQFDEQDASAIAELFKQQFNVSISQGIIQALRDARQQKNFKDMRQRFKQIAQTVAQQLKPPIIQKFKQLSKDVAQGLRSQISKSLAFLPDFIKRPLLKGIQRQIQGIRKSLIDALTNAVKKSSFLKKGLEGGYKLLKSFSTQLIVMIGSVAMLVKMFSGVQNAWTDINKQFGIFSASFDQFSRMMVNFSMQSGLAFDKFVRSAKAVIAQFGFLDQRAIKTSAQITRVFGLGQADRRKLLRVVGGPGQNIKETLDQVSKATIDFGGHANRVFKDIIRMSQKFRSLTQQQRKQFIRLSSQLSAVGVSGQTVIKSMTQGFSSIDKALQTTKQINLAMLQLGLNAGKNYKMFSATRSIDLYKAMRVGDINKAFKILTSQLGDDFIKNFDKIKSAAGKQKFLQTMFGDVQAGQKIMDRMKGMLNAFGTTQIESIKKKFQGIFDPGEDGGRKLNAFATQLQKMRLSTDQHIRKQAKAIFQGGERQLVQKLKVKVQTDVQAVKTFEDMAKATRTMSQRFSQMWTGFKRGFMKGFLPFINSLNDIFKTRDPNKFAEVGAALGNIIGSLIIFTAKIRRFFVPFAKILAFFSKSIGFISKIARLFGGVVGKLFVPLGIILTIIQSVGTFVKYLSKTQSVFGMIGLAITSIIDAIISPFTMLINLIAGTNISSRLLTQARFGKARGGAFVKATPGGEPMIVGQGKHNQVIAPTPMMQSMADRRASRVIVQTGPQSRKMLARLQKNNQLMQKMLQNQSKPMTIKSGKINVQGQFAQIVDRQISYAN